MSDPEKINEVIRKIACDTTEIKTGMSFMKESVDKLQSGFESMGTRLTIIEQKATDAKETASRVRNWTLIGLSVIGTAVTLLAVLRVF
jgi:hypothetical protein